MSTQFAPTTGLARHESPGSYLCVNVTFDNPDISDKLYRRFLNNVLSNFLGADEFYTIQQAPIDEEIGTSLMRPELNKPGSFDIFLYSDDLAERVYRMFDGSESETYTVTLKTLTVTPEMASNHLRQRAFFAQMAVSA